jgi:hypothetical protein
VDAAISTIYLSAFSGRIKVRTHTKLQSTGARGDASPIPRKTEKTAY